MNTMFARWLGSFRLSGLNRRSFLKYTMGISSLWLLLRSSLGLAADAETDTSKTTDTSSASDTSSTSDTSSKSDTTTTTTECVPAELLTQWKNLIDSPDDIQIWVDGFRTNASGTRRANLAILIKRDQSAAAYVNIVYLVRKDSDVVSSGFRYFDSGDRLQAGYPPYIIFNNIDLSLSDRFSLVYSVRTADQDLGYVRTITSAELKRSRLNKPEVLGPIIKEDLYTAHNKGIPSSLIEFSSLIKATELPKTQLSCKFLKFDGKDVFVLQVNFIKPDVAPTSYNRYFMITDPVGRIISVVKREAPKVGETSVMLAPLTEKDRVSWRITQDQVAKLSDCPYIMVFADYISAEPADRMIAKAIIYLR